MASVVEIRLGLRGQRIELLRSRIEPLLAGWAGAAVWLFGSLCRQPPSHDRPSARLATSGPQRPRHGD